MNINGEFEIINKTFFKNNRTIEYTCPLAVDYINILMIFDDNLLNKCRKIN